MNKPGTQSSNPSIRARNLDIGFPNEIIVPNIQFELQMGQSLALVGVNGSGKSTLLKTLVGLFAPLKGELEVLETIPGKAPRRIAYLPQSQNSGFILPLCAIDVVRMGRFANHGLFGKMTSEDELLVRQAMQRMDISALADKPLRSLSGGQQQRVYLSQVLARQADLLILDEPTAGLDAGGKELYMQAIREDLQRGASVVVATHNINEAINCNQAMLLARRVIALGKGKDILTPEALLEAFGMIITMDGQHPGVAVMELDHGHGPG